MDNKLEAANANDLQAGEAKAKPAKYLDLIGKSNDQIDKEQKDLWAEESEMNIKGDILSTKKEIAAAKRELERLKSAKPINPQEVIKQSQKLKALENGVKALEELKDELF